MEPAGAAAGLLAVRQMPRKSLSSAAGHSSSSAWNVALNTESSLTSIRARGWRPSKVSGRVTVARMPSKPLFSARPWPDRASGLPHIHGEHSPASHQGTGLEDILEGAADAHSHAIGDQHVLQDPGRPHGEPENEPLVQVPGEG